MKDINVIKQAQDEIDQIIARLSIWNMDEKYFEHHSDCGRALDDLRQAYSSLGVVVSDHDEEMAREGAEIMREAV